LVYFDDGSVLAQKGSPDMRVPLAYCMAYPQRIETGVADLDLARLGSLDFEAADRNRFPCLALAEAALKQGGNAPNRLNAANEVAVSAFLEGRIGFLQIGETVEKVLSRTAGIDGETLEEIVACDGEARAQAADVIKAL
jgi:1-deoxy-D-xylulose-5-phosphate reductoisomerase